MYVVYRMHWSIRVNVGCVLCKLQHAFIRWAFMGSCPTPVREFRRPPHALHALSARLVITHRYRYSLMCRVAPDDRDMRINVPGIYGGARFGYLGQSSSVMARRGSQKSWRKGRVESHAEFGNEVWDGESQGDNGEGMPGEWP